MRIVESPATSPVTPAKANFQASVEAVTQLLAACRAIDASLGG